MPTIALPVTKNLAEFHPARFLVVLLLVSFSGYPLWVTTFDIDDGDVDGLIPLWMQLRTATLSNSLRMESTEPTVFRSSGLKFN